MNAIEEALSLFKEGFNWTQSLFAAYGNKLGIDEGTALKIASAFGGGIGRTGETCGAVTGALIIIGLIHSVESPRDRAAKERVYALSARLMNEFRAVNGSLSCRDLIGFDIGSNKDPEKLKIISRRCPQFIRNAAEILEEIE